MTIKEILEKCKGLEVSEERDINSEYGELVFLTKDLDKWDKVFVDILGPAIKPAGAEPTMNDHVLTKDYGGIYDNQTLFKKDFDNTSVMAMFWPWGDNTHTTLKLAVIKKEDGGKSL
ncbi:hypothetical protein ACFL2Y_04375 [Candidatus Omnitrophota bacterium]